MDNSIVDTTKQAKQSTNRVIQTVDIGLLFRCVVRKCAYDIDSVVELYYYCDNKEREDMANMWNIDKA